MNSMERLQARLAGKPVDKIPNLNIVMALVAKQVGASYREYAQDYRVLVEGNLRCVEEFGFDSVSAISDPMRETAGFGAEISFPENGVPYSPVPLLGSGLDPEKVHRYDPFERERTLDRIHAVELFKQKVGEEVPIIGWVEGVLAETADLRGVDTLMMDLAEGADGLVDVMDMVFEQQCRFAKAQIDAGAHIIGVGNAVASLIGPGLYEEFALDYDRRMVEYIHSHGALVKLHICGNIKALLPLLQQVAPDILDVDWMVDFKLAVDTFRGKPTSVCGNLDPVAVFLQSTVEELRQSVQSAIRVSDETTFIAGGCEIPVDTPAENLYEMNRLLYR